ncbi:MAG: hypothetical protein HOH19_03260 [Kordiimonadaceae bacterium]|jgi:hypothetical protein|nr:hypothetical protein [Kordiimonadaceae bacterium]
MKLINKITLSTVLAIISLYGFLSTANAQDKALVLPRGWSGTGMVSTVGARLMLFWHRNDN